jgi:hypothetical protein
MNRILILILICAGSLDCQIKNLPSDAGRSIFGFSSSSNQESQTLPGPVFPDRGGGDDKKSVSLAALYSFLLPGMGELYAGDYSFGKYLTMVEGGLVITLLGFDRYANWLQDDAHGFAALHAQANIAGKDDRYFAAIGDFDNVYAYNEEILRDREPVDVYNPNSSYYWRWDNTANRNAYRDLKISSDERFNDTRFIAAAIAVNHLISVVDAVRMAVKHNKNISGGDAFDLHADVIGGLAAPSGIRFTLIRRF